MRLAKKKRCSHRQRPLANELAKAKFRIPARGAGRLQLHRGSGKTFFCHHNDGFPTFFCHHFHGSYARVEMSCVIKLLECQCESQLQGRVQLN